MYEKHSFMPITATGHNNQGTLTWQDANKQTYISATCVPNTPLLSVPGYETAGTLIHTNGNYELNQTTCRQRGRCASWCECTDCPKCQQGATGEDFDTAGPMLDKVKAGVKGMVAKGAEYTKKAGAAAKKATVATVHAAVEAARTAKVQYEKKHAELNAKPQEGADEKTPQEIEEGLKVHEEHFKKCIKDAEQEMKDLEALQKDQKTTAEQKNQLKKMEDEVSALVSGLGTMFAHM